MRRNETLSLIGSLGLLLIAVGVLIPILYGEFPESPIYKIIYTAGAITCIVASLLTKTPADLPLRDRRWIRIEAWSSIFFCAAAAFMWWPGAAPRDWLAFTLAGAAIRIIVFFRSLRRK